MSGGGVGGRAGAAPRAAPSASPPADCRRPIPTNLPRNPPGDERATYIFVDLSDVDPAALPDDGAGASIEARAVGGQRAGQVGAGGPATSVLPPTPLPPLPSQGLETQHPALVLADGRRLVGDWREPVGSLLFADAGPAGGAPSTRHSEAAHCPSA